MKTYEQLMKHYWGVIVPTAEAAGINPWECVRHVNEDKFTDHPKFEGKPWNYTFALTVLEGKPVFVGDKLWNQSDCRWDVIDALNCKYNLNLYTWTPPTKKRTFMLELEEGDLLYLIGEIAPGRAGRNIRLHRILTDVATTRSTKMQCKHADKMEDISNETD